MVESDFHSSILEPFSSSIFYESLRGEVYVPDSCDIIVLFLILFSLQLNSNDER